MIGKSLGPLKEPDGVGYRLGGVDAVVLTYRGEEADVADDVAVPVDGGLAERFSPIKALYQLNGETHTFHPGSL